MITTIIILSITTLVFGFTTWNLLRKNEATEDVVEEQEKMISDFAKLVDDSMRKMKDLDTKGAFESDDETGFVFKQLYEIIETIRDLCTKYTHEHRMMFWDNDRFLKCENKIRLVFIKKYSSIFTINIDNSTCRRFCFFVCR